VLGARCVPAVQPLGWRPFCLGLPVRGCGENTFSLSRVNQVTVDVGWSTRRRRSK
jgi:hypothetical protein